jgi:hypothetical protein
MMGFLEDSTPLRVDDGFVYIATLYIETDNRRPVRILKASAIKHRQMADGTLDEDHWMEHKSAAINAALGGAWSSSPGIVGSEKMARRRLEVQHLWPLTPEIAALLRPLLARRGFPVGGGDQ